MLIVKFGTNQFRRGASDNSAGSEHRCRYFTLVIFHFTLVVEAASFPPASIACTCTVASGVGFHACPGCGAIMRRAVVSNPRYTNPRAHACTHERSRRPRHRRRCPSVRACTGHAFIFRPGEGLGERDRMDHKSSLGAVRLFVMGIRVVPLSAIATLLLLPISRQCTADPRANDTENANRYFEAIHARTAS